MLGLGRYQTFSASGASVRSSALKSLALTFVLCLALGLAACGDDDDSTTGSTEAGAPAADAGGAAEKTKPKVTVPKGAPPKTLEVREIEAGSGPEAKAGDEVTVHYVGVNFKNGEEFDASWDRGEPFTFPLGAGEGDPGLGPGRRGDEGRRPARADHPARTRLRPRRPAAGDRAQRNADLRHRSARSRLILAERLTAQGLAGPPLPDPVAVAERLLAVQGQDPRGARLAVRARTEGLSAADVDRCLGDDRSLLITWLNRGTLHLVRSEDYPWLQALTTPPLQTGNARRLAQEGVTPAEAERGVKAIERALAADGPLTRVQLRERLDSAGVPTAGQALVHLLMLACLRGIAVRGPMVGRQHAYVLVRDWLDPLREVDRETALTELARRYLAGHGPAGERDLARWAGLPLRDVRKGLAGLASEVEERGDGLLALVRRRPAAELPPPRLLGTFEPVLLGWTSREEILGDRTELVTVNGIFRPFAMVDGRAVATWKLSKGRVEIEPLARLSREVRAALEEDAADVERFMEAY